MESGKRRMKYYGIYKITNKVNGKMYIGQHITSNLDDGYLGSGTIIAKAVKKYGKESFTKEWLEFAENAEDLNYLERMYVDEEWLARPDVYNIALGGSQISLTDSIRKKISVATRKRLSNKENHPMFGKLGTFTGRRHSESTKQKISTTNKGKNLRNQHTAEWKEEMSKKNAGSGNPFYGRTHTLEARQKMSLAAKNRDNTNHQISVSVFNISGECIDTLPSCYSVCTKYKISAGSVSKSLNCGCYVKGILVKRTPSSDVAEDKADQKEV